MRRTGARHVVLVLGASILAGGASLWHWMNRPAIKLRCPGGGRPDDVVIGSTIGIGHGVMSSALRLEGERFTTRFLTTVPPERSLSGTEKDSVFHRLEHPAALPAGAPDTEVWLLVAWDCAGVPREEELTASFRRPAALARWLEDPLGALRSLDPRPGRILAAATEVMEIAVGE